LSMVSRSLSSPLIQTIEPLSSTRQVQHLRKAIRAQTSHRQCRFHVQVEPGTAPVLPSRHRAVSRSIWSNTVGVYEICPEMSEAKASFVDHKPKRFGPVKSFVSARDPFVLHREETFKFGNQQIMRLGARPNAPSQRGH
ncbi:unnamed protein product, partial [Symbiodinium necroappetens]